MGQTSVSQTEIAQKAPTFHVSDNTTHVALQTAVKLILQAKLVDNFAWGLP